MSEKRVFCSKTDLFLVVFCCFWPFSCKFWRKNGLFYGFWFRFYVKIILISFLFLLNFFFISRFLFRFASLF